MNQPPRIPPIDHPPIRLAVCVSGGGTTLQNLIERITEGSLRASIDLAIASKEGIAAIPKAHDAGIPVKVIAPSGPDAQPFSHAVFTAVRQHQADLVVLGGFLHLLPIPEDYLGKVINIHPALIPAFCGKGHYGKHVHQAALDRGVKVSGCTVHFADDRYDHGPIILQRTVSVLDGDTAADLAARVFKAECEALPDAISLYAAGRIVIQGQVAHIQDSGPIH